MLPCSPVKQQPICGGSSSDINSALGPIPSGVDSCNKNMVNSSDVGPGTTTPTAPTNGDPYTFVDPENDNNIPVLPAQHRLAKNRKLANVRHGSSDGIPGANEHAVDGSGVNFSGHPQQQGNRPSMIMHQNQNPGARLPVSNGPSPQQFGGAVKGTGPVQYPPNGNSQQPQGSGGFASPSSAQQFQQRSGTAGGPGGHFIALPPPPPIPTPPQVVETNGPWSSPQQQVGIRPVAPQPLQNQQQQRPQFYQLPIAAYQQRQETAQHARQFVMQDHQQGQFAQQQQNAHQSSFPVAFPTQQPQIPQQQLQFSAPPPNQRNVKAETTKESSAPKRKSSSNNLAPLAPGSTPNGPSIPSPIVTKQIPMLHMQQNSPQEPILPILQTEELLDNRVPILARVSFGQVASKLPSFVGKERPATRNKGIIQQCAARVYFPSEAAFMAYAYWASRRMFHSDIVGHSDADSADESALLNHNRSPVVEDVDTEIAETPMRSEWFLADDEITTVSPSQSVDGDNLPAIENRRIAIDRLRTSLKQAVLLRRSAFKTNTMPRGHNALEAQQLAQLFAEDRRLLYRLLHRTRISAPDRSIVRRILRLSGGPEAFSLQNRKRCACDISSDSGAPNSTQNDSAQGQNCQRCQNPALPFANHCPLHITYSVDQKLFEHCTGRSNGIQRCHRPTFDVRRPQAPLCNEHVILGSNWNGSGAGGSMQVADGQGGAISQNAAQGSSALQPEAPKSAKRKRSRAKKKAAGNEKPPGESTSVGGLTSSFSSPPNPSQNTFSTSEPGANNGPGNTSTTNNNDFNDILNSSAHETNLGEVGPDMHLFDDNMIDDFLSTLPADSRDFHRILQDSQQDRGQGDMDPFGPPDQGQNQGQGQQQNQSGQGGSGGNENGSSSDVTMILGEQGGEQQQQPQSQQQQQQNFPQNQGLQQQQQFGQPLQSPSSSSSASTNRNWPVMSPSQQPPSQQQIAQPNQGQQAQPQQPQQQMQSPASNFPQQQQQQQPNYIMPPPWSPNGPVQQQQQQQGPPSDQQQQQMQFPPQSPQRPPMNSPAAVNVFFGNQNPATPQGNPQTMNGFISPGPQQPGQPGFHYQQTPPHHHSLMKSQSLQPGQMAVVPNGPMSMPMSPAHHQAVQQQPGPPPGNFPPQQQQQFAAPPLHRTFSQPQQMEVSHPIPPSHLGLQQPRPPHFAAGVHSSPMHSQPQGGFISQQGGQPAGYQQQQPQYIQHQQAHWMQQQQQATFMPHQQQQMYMAPQQQQQQQQPQFVQQQQFVGGQMTMHHLPQQPQNRSMYQQ